MRLVWISPDLNSTRLKDGAIHSLPRIKIISDFCSQQFEVGCIFESDGLSLVLLSSWLQSFSFGGEFDCFRNRTQANCAVQRFPVDRALNLNLVLAF